MLCRTVFEDGEHVWLAFGNDAERAENLSDINIYVVCSGDSALLVDPGGPATFAPMLSAISDKVALDKIDAIFLSHTDPDVAASLPMWRQVLRPDVAVYASEHLVSEIAHLDPSATVVPIPDGGAEITFGQGTILEAIPAHHLDAPACFQLFDTDARVLYSADLGSAWADSGDTEFSGDFDAVASEHEAAYLRRMPMADARQSWVARVSALGVDALAPHSGPVFRNGDVSKFVDWFADLGGDQIPTMDAAVSTMPLEPAPEPEPVKLSDDIVDASEPRFAPADDEPAPSEHSLPPDLGFPDEEDGGEVGISDDINSILANIDAQLSDEPPEMEGELAGLADADDDDEDIGSLSEEDIPLIPNRKFRLITRSDFDGLACAVLFEELGMIDDILFVNPNDMQEGRVDVSTGDISTNVPFVPGIYMAFDHHLSEVKRVGEQPNHIIDASAPSAARVVYNYYGGKATFPNVQDDMMEGVDQADAAQFSMEEVLDPQGWPLLSFVMDSRTGLGRFRGFRVPNYELMMSLIDYCREYPIEDILEHPDVKERVELYREQAEPFKEQLQRCATVHGNLVVLDLREEETIYVGNRFMIYALFPDCNISIHCLWGRAEQNTVFACGKSIFNRTSNTNVGELMLTYGGGGHGAAGTCQVDNALADIVRQALINRINEDG